MTEALLIKRLQCVPSDDWRTLTATVVIAWGVMADAILLHLSLLRAEWKLKNYYCISHHPIWSDGWRENCMRCHGVGNVWRNINASPIIFCGIMSEALLLYQSSLLAAWWVGSVMTGALLPYQSPMCAEWWLVYSCFISHQCVLSDDWWTLALSVINTCVVMTGVLLLYQS